MLHNACAITVLCLMDKCLGKNSNWLINKIEFRNPIYFKETCHGLLTVLNNGLFMSVHK
jgi:hypothetical protein